ncbi:reverse transcriptase domain-containing protein [Tanacetum coccineum]
MKKPPEIMVSDFGSIRVEDAFKGGTKKDRNTKKSRSKIVRKSNDDPVSANEEDTISMAEKIHDMERHMLEVWEFATRSITPLEVPPSMELGQRKKKEKSLDYNNSFLGEYGYSSLALDKEERRDEKNRLDHLKQDQTMLVIKRFSERKKVFRERKKTGKIHEKRFEFEITNNEAEYEALLAGLRIAADKKIEVFSIFVDSKLVANHVKGLFEARQLMIKKYLEKTKDLLRSFNSYTMEHV